MRTYRVLILLDSPEPDAKSLILNTYRASELIYYPSTRSTWDEIVSSGELDLLPRNAVNNGLALYFSRLDIRLEASQNLRHSPYRANVRGLILHSVQKAIRANCGDVLNSGKVIKFSTECILDLPEALLKDTADTLTQDETLEKDLRYHGSTVEVAYITLNSQVNILERMISLPEGDEANSAE